MASTGQLEARLQKKIRTGSARIGVLGLGYVGLPLAIEFCRAGFAVTGVDSDTSKLKSLKAGKIDLTDLNATTIRRMTSSGKLRLTSQNSELSKCDCIIICVPTPLNKVKEPDISFVLRAVTAVRQQLKKGQLVVLESTVYPGTTEEVVLPQLNRKNSRVGSDFFLCFSPERIDPGNKDFPLRKIPKVIGGMTNACTRLGSSFYGKIIKEVVPVSSPRVAEMAKLLENTFRIVNIGLMNELVPVSNRLGVNLWEAIDAAKTKPFGYMPFYPGPGIGGHCIGIDPLYLSWKAKTVGSELRFVELASRVNGWMPNYVIRRIVYELNSIGKATSKSKVLLLGVSYKRNVGDVRESPALEILTELRQLSATVSFHDPFVPSIRLNGRKMSSVKLNSQTLRKQDLIVIMTPHSNVAYDLIAKHSKRIFDTRNAMSRFRNYRKKIVLL